jgi:hypothetical protein
MNRRSALTRALIYLLRLTVGLGLTLALGGARSPAMDMVFEQFQIIGPLQWLSLLTVGADWPRLGASRERTVSVSAARARAFAPANDNTSAQEVARAS